MFKERSPPKGNELKGSICDSPSAGWCFPDALVKGYIPALGAGNVETAVGLGIKSWLTDLGS